MKKTNKTPSDSLCLTFNKSIPFTLGFKSKDIVRFVYLATFLQPDGKLRDRNGRYIEWCDLPRVLGVDKYTLNDFTDNVRSNDLIQEDSSGRLSIRKNLFSTGDSDSHNNGYDRIYLSIDDIQELYETTSPLKHRVLGYLFMAIPYINKELNCFCKNPSQVVADLIIPMSVREYCGFIGYDVAHYGDLEEALLGLRFRDEPLITNINLVGKDAYFVNPRLYYGGSQRNVVYRYAGFEQPSIYSEGRAC